MKIQLVSYVHGLSNKMRLDITSSIFNDSTADLLLFCGHTIGSVNDIDKLQSRLTNNKSEAVFELENMNSSKINNCLYQIKQGKIKNLYTNQIFTQSGEIEGNTELGDRFIYEMEKNRKLNTKGRSILIMQCGEINILRNIQNDNNRVEFRLSYDYNLTNRFNKLFSNTDIILNPIHTPMGNQGKMKKRREFLSQNNKYYFSASNTKEGCETLINKSLQYAYHNAKELKEFDRIVKENFISRIYEI